MNSVKTWSADSRAPRPPNWRRALLLGCVACCLGLFGSRRAAAFTAADADTALRAYNSAFYRAPSYLTRQP